MIGHCTRLTTNTPDYCQTHRDLGLVTKDVLIFRSALTISAYQHSFTLDRNKRTDTTNHIISLISTSLISTSIKGGNIYSRVDSLADLLIFPSGNIQSC